MADDTVRVYDTTTYAVKIVLTGPKDGITYVAYSSDGKRIVASSLDGTARIWDAETGKTLRVLRLRSACINAVFSRNGKAVLTASDGGLVQTWRTSDGALLRVFRGHAAQVTDAEYSPDGTQIVSASLDKTARVWDLASGRTIHVLRATPLPLARQSFRPTART